MAQLTHQQIEAQIDNTIVRQSQIDATEPRANKVIYDGGRLRFTSLSVHHFHSWLSL